MANVKFFTLITLCVLCGIGLINASFVDIPEEFWNDEPTQFSLEPKNVNILGHYRRVFTFGNEEERK